MQAQSPSSLVTVTITVMALVVLFVASYWVTFRFIGSVRKTMQAVPASFYTLPTSLIWLLLVPGVAFIVAWVLLPFFIPRSIKKALVDQLGKGQKRVKALVRSGKLLCIASTFSIPLVIWIFSLSHQDFSAEGIAGYGMVAFIFLILLLLVQLVAFAYYWFKLVLIRADLIPKNPVDAKPHTE
jgi:hypothetical protein